MMKKSLIVLLIFISAAAIHAGDLFVKDYDLKVTISFDKEKYRIGEEMILNIEVENLEDDAVYFYTSPYKMNNVKVSILELATSEMIEEKYSKLVELDEMKNEKPEYFNFSPKVIYPDEVLKYRLNLPDYYSFINDGRYKIQVEFNAFPNSSEKHKIYLSNTLFLLLDKSLFDQEFEQVVNTLRKKEEVKRYTPQGTIEFMLNNYRIKDWNNYFLYQDLDKVILSFDNFKDRYLQASRTMKKQLLAEFRQWVMDQPNKELEEYQILDVYESLTDNTSVVKCKIKYQRPAMFHTFIYQYTLQKQIPAENVVKWIVKDIMVLSHSKEK